MTQLMLQIVMTPYLEVVNSSQKSALPLLYVANWVADWLLRNSLEVVDLDVRPRFREILKNPTAPPFAIWRTDFWEILWRWLIQSCSLVSEKFSKVRLLLHLPHRELTFEKFSGGGGFGCAPSLQRNSQKSDWCLIYHIESWLLRNSLEVVDLDMRPRFARLLQHLDPPAYSIYKVSMSHVTRVWVMSRVCESRHASCSNCRIWTPLLTPPLYIRRLTPYNMCPRTLYIRCRTLHNICPRTLYMRCLYSIYEVSLL